MKKGKKKQKAICLKHVYKIIRKAPFEDKPSEGEEKKTGKTSH